MGEDSLQPGKHWLHNIERQSGCVSALMRSLQISNAFKFTTKGHIRVSTSVDAHYFYLHVEDTGLGIPADQLASIFERFVRVENSQARSIEGSGIGLSRFISGYT